MLLCPHFMGVSKPHENTVGTNDDLGLSQLCLGSLASWDCLSAPHSQGCRGGWVPISSKNYHGFLCCLGLWHGSFESSSTIFPSCLFLVLPPFLIELCLFGSSPTYSFSLLCVTPISGACSLLFVSSQIFLACLDWETLDTQPCLVSPFKGPCAPLSSFAPWLSILVGATSILNTFSWFFGVIRYTQILLP